jgi:hypothetical protein
MLMSRGRRARVRARPRLACRRQAPRHHRVSASSLRLPRVAACSARAADTRGSSACSEEEAGGAGGCASGC